VFAGDLNNNVDLQESSEHNVIRIKKKLFSDGSLTETGMFCLYIFFLLQKVNLCTCFCNNFQYHFEEISVFTFRTKQLCVTGYFSG
jgi:hypothetical protein